MSPGQMGHMKKDTAPALPPDAALAIGASSCSGEATGKVVCTTSASRNRGKAVLKNTQNRSTSSAICLGWQQQRQMAIEVGIC